MLSIAISRRQIYLLWCLAWFLLVVLLMQPIGYGIMRLAIVGTVVATWSGSLYLWWRRVALRMVTIAVTSVLVLFLLLPGRPVNIESLRAEYIRSLHTYLGTTYVWGGENHWGIDCSGLVRQGLIQADFKQGLTTLNPTLMRQGLAMWWFDLSAQALHDGDRGWTTRLFSSASINAINSTRLLPGDLAATVDGQHILAYVGRNSWIEADPGYHRTMVVNVPDPVNIWFGVPVDVLRWQQLDLNERQNF
jgi:hypothetical protein